LNEKQELKKKVCQRCDDVAEIYDIRQIIITASVTLLIYHREHYLGKWRGEREISMIDLIVQFCWIESEISLKTKTKQKTSKTLNCRLFKRRIIVSVYLHLHLGRL